MDRKIKQFDETGHLLSTTEAKGKVIKGCVIPGTDNYLVSTVEGPLNQVAEYRKKFFKKELGPFDDVVLDLEVRDGKVFIPKEMIIEKIEY